MEKRRGFVMMWALAVMGMVLILASAAAFCLVSLVQRQRDTEIMNDMSLLAQDAMEREKYRTRFGVGGTGISGEVERNGRSYTVEWERREAAPSGVPMTELTCRVTHGGTGRTFSVSTMVER